MNIQYSEEMYESLLKKQTITEVKLDLANLKIKELTKEVEKYKEALKGVVLNGMVERINKEVRNNE